MDKEKLIEKIYIAVEDVYGEVLADEDKPGDLTPFEACAYDEHIEGLADILFDMLHRGEAEE